jgi:hypothetical protein
MRSALQEMLREGASAIEAHAGQEFVTKGGLRLKAWPVQNPTVVAGRIDASPESNSFYETSSPRLFERGEVLRCEDGFTYTVQSCFAFNPTTGTFKFSVGPGRKSK